MQRDPKHWEAVAGIVAVAARTACPPERMAVALRRFAAHERCDEAARLRFRDAANLLDTTYRNRRRVWLVGHIRPAGKER